MYVCFLTFGAVFFSPPSFILYFLFQELEIEKFFEITVTCKMESPKRRKICKVNDKNPKLSALSIESLPNEIFMNIFSHLNIKDLFKCGKVNKKFRQISHDKSFWKCVNLYNQRVSGHFVAQILELGTEYLNLQEVILDDSEAVIPRKNNLKYLNLAFSSVEDKFLVKLLRSSVCLEKISLRDVNPKHIKFCNLKQSEDYRLAVNLRRSWYIECLLPNAKLLTTLDLSNSAGKMYTINTESMEEILLNCVELKEANFAGQITDVEFFANNLTPKIEKLNISWNPGFNAKHIVPLVKRCKNITELDLNGCDLDFDRFLICLIAIFKNLSQSLVKLQLPDHSFLYTECIKSLPKLRYLWMVNCIKDTNVMKNFPHVFFNEGTAKIAHCANEYFEPEQGFWEVKCPVVDLSKTQ